MKINGLVVPAVTALALLGAVITGAIAYGQQKERVNDHDRRIGQLEQTPLQVQKIDKATAVMKEKIEALTREQRDFRSTTVKALDRILRKLDE